MSSQFKVGDLVRQVDSGVRMKVVGIEEAEGRVRCSWTRGSVKYTRSFAADLLTTLALPLRS